jgi:hypothetical protein
MRKPAFTPYRITLCIVVLVLLWGLSLSLFELQPFWIDEWRLIYNLKFSQAGELWKPLKYTQQFPRLYLAALKAVTEAFNFSYASLRLPAWFVSLGSLLLAWRLMLRIFPQRGQVFSLLFVVALISSPAFTEYMVQTKHYAAEIFLALLAIWQLLELRSVIVVGMSHPARYLLLCLSMAIAPFFSYTYPIAIAPVFLLTGIQAINALRSRSPGHFLLLSLPLLLGVLSIGLFYYTDVRQLMNDEAMHRYWAYRMSQSGLLQSMANLWYFFAYVGAGLGLEIVFGVLGIAGFLQGLWHTIPSLSHAHTEKQRWLQTYAVLLVLLVLGLFLAGKLPLGEAKFSAFCVPVLVLLSVFFVQYLYGRFGTIVFAIACALYVVLLGNIASVIYQSFNGETRNQRMAIYDATQRAIGEAQALHAPILVTPEVALPDLIVHKVPFLENISADAVLRTFPAYDARIGLPVYTIADTTRTTVQAVALPAATTAAMVGNGSSFRLLRVAH